MAETNVASTADREIVITRTVDAPRTLVWQAWTQPGQIEQWWGPNGFRTTTYERSVKVGGVWRFTMHGPDARYGATDFPNRIIYREIVKPERLVYDHDDDAPSPTHVFHATITFEEDNGRTKITLRSLFPTVEARDATIKFGAVEGGKQTLARMEAHLAAMKSQA
jgi:uncharacterized protein YndB with AHSA1/START domain